MFDQIVDRVCATLWNLEPAAAVSLGKHEYDGVVPDISDPAVASHLDRLEILRGQLVRLDGLSDDQQVDRLALRAAIDTALFAERVLAPRRRSPMHIVSHLDVDAYLRRAHAPKALRVERMAELLEQAPALLSEARRTLQTPIPSVVASRGIAAACGRAEALTDDLPAAIEGTGDPRIESRARHAAAAAAAQLRAFAEWIGEQRAPQADDPPAIGGDLLEEMLRVGELVDVAPDDLLVMGEEDLAANRDAFVETAALIDADLEPREAYERHVASVRPSAAESIPSTRAMLERIRRFVVDRDLVTIPGGPRPQVAEMPRHLRWAVAMMDTPGPYETEAIEAWYYVTPVEAESGERPAEERAVNRFTLEDISIREAYPGHHVHALHVAGAPTEVSRRVGSCAFTEGWAHYAEQMMWEEGFADGDPRFRLAQLAEALVNSARFVCAIRMHAEGMSVERAARFFMDAAFCDEVLARSEAERGAFDPGSISPTLGKLQILRLRDDCRRAWGAGFTLKRFHDAVLSRGAPPVELMRRVML